MLKRLYQKIIISLYQKIRKNKFHFHLATKEINVKKGRLKFTAFFIETPEGNIKLNISRHE